MTIVKTSDIEHRKHMKKALKNNNGYCPCSPTKLPEDKCMCKDFRDKFDDENWFGFCGCEYFEKQIGD
jgi:hypothetical protein